MTKLVFISDTHGQEPEVEDGDILIHCGDLTMVGRSKEYKRAFDWLNSLPHRHKLYILGNHDFPDDLKYVAHHYGSMRQLKTTSVTEVDGLRFVGLPYVVNLPRWAYNHDEFTLEQIAMNTVATVGKADVLVTHSPPYGILDQCVINEKEGSLGHVGAKAYTGLAAKLGAKVHAFGHIHEDGGVIKELGGIKYVNACALDERYKLRGIKEGVVLEL